MSDPSLYSPLTGPNEIRLFNLQPGPAEAEICCDVVHVFLQDNPDYEALSYTWQLDGPVDTAQNDEQLCTIKVSSETLTTPLSCPVTQNLYNALQRLRHQSEPRALWVDAICINQEDTSERNHQVQIMSKIYSEARLVIIWLGEEDSNDKLAFDLLHKWYKTSTTSEGYTFNEFRELWTRSDGSAARNSPQWSAVAAIFRRRWFRRVWVMQEAVMAADAILLSGSLSLPWIMLEEFLGSVQRFRHTTSLHIAGGDKTAIGRMMAQMITSIRRARTHEVMIPLLPLMSATRKLEATDPRDKFYSLYASAQGADVPIPDYSITAEELFKKTTSTILESSGSLEILSSFNFSYLQNGHDVATWAPSWVSGSLDWNPLLGTGENYAASGDRAAELKISEDGLALTLRGIQFDKVSSTGRALDDSAAASISDLHERYRESCRQALIYLRSCEATAESTRQHSHAISAWLERILPIKRWSHSASDFEEAFCRTLVCNATTVNGAAVSKDIVKGYRSYKKTMIMTCMDPPENPTENLIQESALIAGALAIWTGGRVFGRTRNGYMGLLPSSAEHGDIICVFMGGHTPFVIRPKENGFFQLIGACYIHGMMNGEIFTLPNFEHRLEYITLR